MLDIGEVVRSITSDREVPIVAHVQILMSVIGMSSCVQMLLLLQIQRIATSVNSYKKLKSKDRLRSTMSDPIETKRKRERVRSLLKMFKSTGEGMKLMQECIS